VRGPSRTIPALALLTALVLSASVGAQVGLPNLLMSVGDNEHLWVVRTHVDGDRFDVLAWPAGGAQADWRHVAESLGGQPRAIAATGGQLHVLLGDPFGYLLLDPTPGSPRHGLHPRDEHWPNGAVPVAACDARSLNQGNASLAVVVELPPAPAAQPTSDADNDDGDAEAPEEELVEIVAPTVRLGVFRTVGGQWEFLAERDITGPLIGQRVDCLAVGDALYLLISGPNGPTQVAQFRENEWRDLAVHESWTDAAVGLVDLAGKATIVVAEATEDEQVTVLLAPLDDNASAPQRVMRDGADLTWPAETDLSATTLKGQAVLAWQTGDTLAFVVCAANGAAEPERSVDILQPVPTDHGGAVIWQGFVIALAAGTFICILTRRPPKPQAILELPRRIRPASLGKRFLAGVIDAIPAGVVYLVAAFVVFQEQLAQFSGNLLAQRPADMALLERLAQTRAFAIIIAASLMVYLLYGFIAELRFGATPGKRLLGLTVIGVTGRRPNVQQALIRNLVKVLVLASVPGFALLILVAVPMFTLGRRRFGDLLAGTIVVELTPEGSPTSMPEQPHDSSPEDEPPSRPD
jgi:uncharacterized RDD family membrane protein YckC